MGDGTFSCMNPEFSDTFLTKKNYSIYIGLYSLFHKGYTNKIPHLRYQLVVYRTIKNCYKPQQKFLNKTSPKSCFKCHLKLYIKLGKMVFSESRLFIYRTNS